MKNKHDRLLGMIITGVSVADAPAACETEKPALTEVFFPRQEDLKPSSSTHSCPGSLIFVTVSVISPGNVLSEAAFDTSGRYGNVIFVKGDKEQTLIQFKVLSKRRV